MYANGISRVSLEDDDDFGSLRHIATLAAVATVRTHGSGLWWSAANVDENYRTCRKRISGWFYKRVRFASS